MTSRQIVLIRSSWTLIGSIEPEALGALFYNRLFEIAPGLKHMFRQSMAEQSKKLLDTLGYAIDNLDRLEDIVEDVVSLAQRHVSYGVRPEHYTVVGEALLWTLEKGLGEHWNEELNDAWIVWYVTFSSAMLNAAKYIRWGS